MISVIIKQKPDLILTSSDVLHFIWGAVLAKLLQKPLVIDLYDDYSQFGVARIPLLKSLYKKSLRSAQGIVTVSNTLKSAIVVKYPEIPVVTIESTIGTGQFQPLDKEECRATFGISDKKLVVGLCGGLNSEHAQFLG